MPGCRHSSAVICADPAVRRGSKHRGDGIGKLLLSACEAFARKTGCSAMEVTSAMARDDTHGFYRHVGYSGVAIKFTKTIA